MEPALHGEGSAEPEQANPDGHSVQSAALSELAALPYEPALHQSGSTAPSGQNAPTSQGKHAVLPLLGW